MKSAGREQGRMKSTGGQKGPSKSAVACQSIDPLLSAYVDHEASPAETQLVEEHIHTCAECRARLHRFQRLEPILQALPASSDRALAAIERDLRPRPELLLEDRPAPLYTRFATVAVLLVFVALAAFVLLRSAPTIPRPVQTAGQPSQPVELSGPVIGISVDGLVDPPTARYVHRAITLAEQQNESVVVWLTPSDGLSQAMDNVAQDFASSTVPTYAYAPSHNPTATALAQSTRGTLEAIPAAAPITWMQMDLGEAVWHRVLDPSTAYLFFVLGLYAIFVELAHPGALVPGITGLIAMGIAAVAFSSLPINWLGVLAVIAGVGFMVLELKASKHGLLLIAGIASLAAGSLVLYALPGLLSPPVLVVVLLVGVVLGLLLVRVAQGVHRLPSINPLQELVGARGVARTALSPDGVVHVNGQMWSARVRGAPVAPGEPVRVVARRGLVLDVVSASSHAAATQKGAHS